MKRINLLAVQDVLCSKSSPLWAPETTLIFPQSHLQVHRAVMIGLGVFVTIANNSVAKEATLQYDGYEFYLTAPFTKHDTDAMVGLWKYITDANFQYMSKVCSHDYTKMEHFFHRKNERLPIDVEGFQTKVVTDPANFETLSASLYIRQTLVRDNLMHEANAQSVKGDVVNLSGPSRDAWQELQRVIN
ncbi:hypothetical protein pEaSNUABM29_00105 [Erwinia phage pEa_SNUABM_29]|nr:hypothetical protein pEaSNUABM29_00105 [Erwinia phage pEa_SNUABM_29]